jgi:cytochrome P450
MLLLTSVLLVMFFTYLFRHYYFTSQNTVIPGLRPQFLFGNLLQTNVLHGEAFISVWSKFQKQYGDIFTFYWFFGERSIILNKVEHVEIIYRNRNLYDMSEYVGSIFGFFTKSGLPCIQGEQYRRHARLILPFFKYSMSKKHLQRIIQYTDEQLVAQWKGRDQQQQVCRDIVVSLQKFCTQITLTIVFGDEIDRETMDLLCIAVNNCTECLGTDMPGILFDLNYAVFNRRYKKAFNFLRNYTKLAVDQELQHQQECGSEDDESKSFLSFLLTRDSCATPMLSETELIDEIILFIFTGHQTPISAVSWLIFHLSKHPKIQERIKDELRNNSITQTTIELTVELLEQLTYVDCVLKEVLRYSPIIPMSNRTVTQDTILDGIQLRKGDTVTLAIQNIHRDPRYWKLDPQLFCPERFLSEDKDHHPSVFLPFGGGHRQCAGQGLARLMIKAISVRLMQFLTFIDAGDDQGNTGGYQVQLVYFPKNIAVFIHCDEEAAEE